MIERVYNIPLRKEYQKIRQNLRTKKAIKAVREFLIKNMKSNDVWLGPHLNEFIWKRGIRNPPHHVKVFARKEDNGKVYAELEGKPLPEFEEKGKKKKVEKKKEEKKEEQEEKIQEQEKAEEKKVISANEEIVKKENIVKEKEQETKATKSVMKEEVIKKEIKKENKKEELSNKEEEIKESKKAKKVIEKEKQVENK